MIANHAPLIQKRRFPNLPCQTLPMPIIGERQEVFFDRAMRALRHSIPSTNRRTIEVLRLWCNSPNDREIRDKASAQFPEESFIHFGPRCVFVAHTVPASEDGQRPAIRYDRSALLKLVQWANYRICNSDNFAAISDGHTPSDEERAGGGAIPEVLGYSGPFYLGLLGDIDPKWAIYAEEWVHRSDVARFEKLQRRSPEVWINEPMECRTMDPIAALGAVTPRLDSGMNPYNRVSDGQTVMRYSAMAFPGPSNSFVPASECRTQRYAGDSSMDDPMSGTVENKPTPYLVRAVQAAVETMMPSILQSVQEQLVGDSVDSAEGDGGDEAQDEASESDNTMSQNEAPEGDAATTDDMDGDEKAQYEAMSAECRDAYLAGRRKGQRIMNYARRAADGGSVSVDAGEVDLHRVVARQQARLTELRTQLERERRDISRYSRLRDLSREYTFDPDDESQTCQDMSEAQFERHCRVTIAKYARRDDVANVELFNDPTLDSERSGRRGHPRMNVEQLERYSREAASIAARKNAAKRGSTTFEAEFDAICKQHGVAI